MLQKKYLPMGWIRSIDLDPACQKKPISNRIERLFILGKNIIRRKKNIKKASDP